MALSPDKAVVIPPEPYNLLKQIAKIEERTLRVTFERALRMYAAKHHSELLKRVSA